MKEGIEVLSNYLKEKSVCGNEKEAGVYLSNFCKSKGLYVRIFTEELNSFNFNASLYPLESGKPNIILLSHIDVVPSGDQSCWKYPPYEGLLKQDTIWGRGAIDAKGLGIMQLTALNNFIKISKEKELPYNISVLVVSNEEEGGSLGAKLLVNNHLEELNPFVVFGEGGSGLSNVLKSDPNRNVFGISVAEKKGVWLKLDVHFFESGHGSVPPNDYANKIMIQALSKLNKYQTKLIFSPVIKESFRQLAKNENGFTKFALLHFNWPIFRPFVNKIISKEPYLKSLLKNTFVITRIENPIGATNQIAESVSAYIDCRLIPGYDKNLFIKELESLINDKRINISIINESPDASLSQQNHIYDYMQKAILENYKNAVVLPVLFPATTDNSHFRSRNITTYGIIPCILNKEQIASVHGPNEHLPIQVFINGVKTFHSFLTHLLEFKMQETASE